MPISNHSSSASRWVYQARRSIVTPQDVSVGVFLPRKIDLMMNRHRKSDFDPCAKSSPLGAALYSSRSPTRHISTVS
uniref:Uncharacterized protein n=1 Tax=Steinernema glaseri TaxID=37863 RepID=A0A1I7YIC4_9BILA